MPVRCAFHKLNSGIINELGAGLGILRNVDFDIAIIDEASQVTEPGALVPLVKGIKKAVLVGDQ